MQKPKQDDVLDWRILHPRRRVFEALKAATKAAGRLFRHLEENPRNMQQACEDVDQILDRVRR